MDNGASSYRRFLDGDDNGLVEIIRSYNDGLTLYLNSFVHNLSVADELSEDVFVKIGVKRPHFSGRASFKTWLYAIGRNMAMDYIRKPSSRVHISIDACAEQADEDRIEKEYLREEQKIMLHKAMYGLKAEYRQVLWLIYFEDMSIREAAVIMKKSVRSVENLVSRARSSLKSELDRTEYFYESL